MSFIGSQLTQARLARLALVMLERFPEVITGYLLDVRIQCGCVIGVIYKDLGGHPDGALITSSEIMELQCHGRRWLIKTRGYACYAVVNFHPHGGRQSLLHLADLFESAALAHSNRWLH